LLLLVGLDGMLWVGGSEDFLGESVGVVEYLRRGGQPALSSTRVSSNGLTLSRHPIGLESDNEVAQAQTRTCYRN
jgi:hypothetical protein